MIPNILTVSRVILVPPALFYIDKGDFDIAVYLMIYIFISDFLDGIIARKFNMVSTLGSILDPIADKLVVLSFFSYLLIINKVNLLYFIIILFRDISQLMSVPVLLLWKKIQFKVNPKMIPKWGTALNFLILGIIGMTIPYPKVMDNEIYLYTINLLYVVSGIIEIYILATYIPRFIQIYSGTHDTFE